uniref:Interleukin-4 n=1 Tax=Cyanistes caeruleus TaxID=156563 RepID=A0A8C0UU87_CYACU
MLPSLKTAFTLLSLIQLISSRAVTPSPQQTLKEVILLIQQLNSGAQVPCNDTRVAQVAFTDRKLPDQELLCQADMALTRVTSCKETYEPLITNLKRLHGKKKCFLRDENEIYLRHFLPALGNFTQGMYRHRGSLATQ